MDNLTHSLVGALLGQTGLKRKTGLAMPALIIGANLPDVDAACFFWLDGVQHLGFRRGITHGPPALVLLPLILAGLLCGFDRWQAKRGKRPVGRLPVHFGWLYALSFIGCLTHPALDWLNSYGIRLLEPFSSRWFYGDTLFIIDIWLWLGMGFAIWLSLRREKKTDGDWRKAGRVGLAGVLAYIGLNAGITAWNEGQTSPADTSADTIASPVPIAFWNRDVIVGSNGLYRMDGRKRGDVPFDQCDLVGVAQADLNVRAFLFWARAPFIEAGSEGVLLRDARFADPLTAGRFSVRLPDDICMERRRAFSR